VYNAFIASFAVLAFARGNTTSPVVSVWIASKDGRVSLPCLMHEQLVTTDGICGIWFWICYRCFCRNRWMAQTGGWELWDVHFRVWIILLEVHDEDIIANISPTCKHTSFLWIRSYTSHYALPIPLPCWLALQTFAVSYVTNTFLLLHIVPC
jgi:hypothetical protein